GRMRQDFALPAIGNLSATEAPRLIFIQDPVAQTSYTLNLAEKTAQKLPMPPPSGAGGGGPEAGVAFSVSTAGPGPGPAVDTENATPASGPPPPAPDGGGIGSFWAVFSARFKV